MIREDIEAFIREMVSSEWNLNRNTRRSREDVVKAIADKWEDEVDKARLSGVDDGYATGWQVGVEQPRS